MVKPVDGKVQVDVKVIVGVILLVPDPVEFLLQVHGAFLVGSWRIYSRRLVRVKVDDTLGDGHHILPDVFAEGKRLETSDDISRVIHWCRKGVRMLSSALGYHHSRVWVAM
jgi:hypothetical protein